MPRQDLIQIRTGTAAQWTTADPTLAVGEIGFISDTNQLVVGDGSTAYSGLTPITGGGGGLSAADIDTIAEFNAIVGDGNFATEVQLATKADALISPQSHAGNYTLLAGDLTLVNAGDVLKFVGDNSGDLTVPLNATVAFPVGTSLALIGYDNVVATGGVTITGTRGDLTVPLGTTAVLEKTATDIWTLHNGSPVNVTITSSTGTDIQFDTDRFYGEGTAETGAFTLNSTGLVKGSTAVVRHNDSANPFLTSDPEFIIVGGEYIIDEDNYIYMHSWSSSVIHCNIVQHP
jgi:hypothetical protein